MLWFDCSGNLMKLYLHQSISLSPVRSDFTASNSSLQSVIYKKISVLS